MGCFTIKVYKVSLLLYIRGNLLAAYTTEADS